MNWQHRTMIVPIALAEPARAACMALTGSASEGLFTTPLYPEGGTEATHAISSGYIAGEFADLLPCGDQPGNIEALLAMLEGVEFPITAEELAGMLAVIDISDEAAEAAMGRLGLSLVPPQAPDEVVT
ncbi:MAG: hypothetical protein RBR38_16740 [Desulfomicrobium apsheronum]|nr:hypothetical protein [Desulfomicrobium apsheronum]